jgi:hypothetical protein
VQQHAEDSGVGALIGGLAFGLLGSHVAGGAQDYAGLRALIVVDSSGFPPPVWRTAVVQITTKKRTPECRFTSASRSC